MILVFMNDPAEVLDRLVRLARLVQADTEGVDDLGRVVDLSTQLRAPSTWYPLRKGTHLLLLVDGSKTVESPFPQFPLHERLAEIDKRFLMSDHIEREHLCNVCLSSCQLLPSLFVR